MIRVAAFAKSDCKVEEADPGTVPDVQSNDFENEQELNADFTPNEIYNGNHNDYEGVSHNELLTEDSSIYSYNDATDDKKLLNKVGLPSGFSVGEVEKQRKGDKKTFYCDMCLVELSSLDTMKSHVSGVKHMRKQMAMDQEREEKIRRGLLSPEEALNAPNMVRAIANPESVKKKVPIRLHEKVRETKDPVVGLKFVKEFIPVSDPEMDPHYRCELCGNQGSSNGMFSHLMGYKHRRSYVEKTLGSHNSGAMSQDQLLRIAKNNSENDLQLSTLIQTTMSDEEYPWPPGKAPWSLEQRGEGVAPEIAKEVNQKPSILALASKINIKLPAPGGVKMPSSNAEALKYLELGRKLIFMSMECDEYSIDDKDLKIMQEVLDSALSKTTFNLSSNV